MTRLLGLALVATVLLFTSLANPAPTAQAQPVWQVVTIPILPAGAVPTGVWDSAKNNVYVSATISTDVPQGFVFHWDGASWSKALSLPGHSMGKVFGTGPSDVYALAYKCTAGSAAGCGADRGGQIYRSIDGGTNWTPQVLPAEVGVNGLSDISGTPCNVHVIVGRDSAGNSRIIRFDCTNWGIVFTGNSDATGLPAALTLLSPNEGYFVSCWGWGRWNGASWTFSGIQFDFCDVNSVWGVRDGGGALHLYTVGNNNFSNGVRVWKFNEATQSFVCKFCYVFADGCCAFQGSAGGVWGSGPNDVYVTGNLPGIEPAHPGRLYHFDGTTWARVTAIGDIPTPTAIWGTAPDDVWVALSDGRLLHFAEPQADVAVTDFDCTGPLKVRVSERALVTCTAILHNFGPKAINLGASLSVFGTAPPACDGFAGIIFDFISMPVSEDLEFPVSFPIHCRERGLHTFEFEATVGSALRDPDAQNNTATARVSVEANVKVVKQPRLANLWLCDTGAAACDNKASGVEEVNLDVELSGPVSSPDPKCAGFPNFQDPDTCPRQSIGAFEFEVRYDAKLVSVKVEPGDLWFVGNPRPVTDPSVSCGTIQGEGFVQFRCVTKGKERVVYGPGTLARVRVTPTADVYSILIPNQLNGIATQLINQDCQLADLQSHPIGIDACDDAAITIRYLEGDVHADCLVDVHDQQQIAFRWGSRLGSLLYNDRYDLEPSAPKKGDGDIDAKDLQLVYGRHGSTCKDPHPPQAPVDPKAKLEPPATG